MSPFIEQTDARMAAVVSAVTALGDGVRIYPQEKDDSRALLSSEGYAGAVATRYHLTRKCLGAMAYADYFPNVGANNLRAMVSEAILAAQPGWCGTFGPKVSDAQLVLGDWPEGNHDMGQMHLLALAYSYYDELTSEAREHLINELLQKGTIDRPGHDPTRTSGAVPVDWPRAGTVNITSLPLVPDVHIKEIGETENHILMIATARYLCNQLLYQRTHEEVHDNRRNAANGGPSSIELVLDLLRTFLRNDFSEYNSKNYSKETRWALLNLCSYAYDHEVRLAARMVLDYLSARFAVSSSDLRRMVPFRRLNLDPKNKTMRAPYEGFMDVGLVDYQLGADILTAVFALRTGNTRAYQSPNLAPLPGSKCQDCPACPEYECPTRREEWVIVDSGHDFMVEVLSDYRLPPSIHDLFVNDLHRRFFQRLHRKAIQGEQASNRNADNMEINAGSPSYLITAGGEPAVQAIPGFLIFGNERKGRGVAVTTSFMPTSQSADLGNQNLARDLIQFGSFSDEPRAVGNYGVAPDFACGYRIYLPPWVTNSAEPGSGKFLFGNKKGTLPNMRNGGPGFYLAIYRDGNFGVMEAFDTWWKTNLNYDQFKAGVLARNPNLNLENGVPAQYTTQNGNRIHFVIYDEGDDWRAAIVSRIEYNDEGDPKDTLRDAGNETFPSPFLSGNIMTSRREAVVEIRNPGFVGTPLVLDMSDKWHPRRVDENGVVEQAGFNNEVWVDLQWTGASEGDFYRPFKTLAAAAAAVADGGVIKIMPGSTAETPVLGNKRMTLVAPIGGVSVGVR